MSGQWALFRKGSWRGNIMASLEEGINLPGEVNNGAFLSHHGTCATD